MSCKTNLIITSWLSLPIGARRQGAAVPGGGPRAAAQDLRVGGQAQGGLFPCLQPCGSMRELLAFCLLREERPVSGDSGNQLLSLPGQTCPGQVAQLSCTPCHASPTELSPTVTSHMV